MEKKRSNLHFKLKKINYISFWVLFILFFAFTSLFFIFSLIEGDNDYSTLILVFIVAAVFVAVLLIFIYIFGTIKFQKITFRVDDYIKNKEYQKGIDYIISIKDINYFFISFDKIYYYLGVLYLYNSQLDYSTSYLDFLSKYSKSDTIVLYNSIKYLGLIYLINNDTESLKKLNEKFLSLRKSASRFVTIDKYNNSEILGINSTLSKIFDSDEEIQKDILKVYSYIPPIKNYLDNTKDIND